jgi:protein-disulfide isomerase
MTLGASGTPAFFVNGRFVNGAKPFTEFAKVINSELQRLNLPIPAAAQNPS